MKTFTILFLILLASNPLFAGTNDTQPTVMRMVCMVTQSAILGNAKYSGRVYVIEQERPEPYDGRVFTDAQPRHDGRMIHTTDDTNFNITVFPQVNNLDSVTNYQELGDRLLSQANPQTNPTSTAQGYRMTMESNPHYSFSWGTQNRNNIHFDVDNPEATGYQDGESGGTLECQTPYSIAYNSGQPEILDEEVDVPSNIVTARVAE